MDKIMQIGKYPERKYRNAWNVYSPEGISPCLSAAMGMGGGDLSR